ncbi:MAG: DUF29 domain-containing protein [Thiohalocapsa sp.]|jgi:hypothetical protein|uniref:DUF29 family protein n=1 Tax=Thiohalocapsa sp. TaxID=2497641 RepID=UPI0025FB9E13|nr:DUF29 family protein [Thiohalocapsa sp.]MCG6943127.1 DUF29 domain-containing protein [Thiohalocapsa sp.]
MSELSDLYETDYAEWARRSAEFLRAGNLGALDIAHLLEELEGMGKTPSLKAVVSEILPEVYADAAVLAAKDRGLPETTSMDAWSSPQRR